MKRLQNKVAEGRSTLPVAMLYSIAIWLLAGLLKEQWWIQFSCFALSVYVMILFNNKNLLIRVYSRMVSSAYIVLACAAVFLFPSLPGAILQLSAVVALLLTSFSYQDKESTGLAFYTFLCLGLASLVDSTILLYLPPFLVIMAYLVYSLSWRTCFASLIGLLTPYWFYVAWLVYQGDFAIQSWISHFAPLADVLFFVDPTTLGIPLAAFLLFLFVLFAVGAVHFIRTSYLDKIRVRQIYYSLMILTLYSYLLTFLYPHASNLTTRMIIITVSPVIAHFVTLTRTRLSNIVFLVFTACALLFTAAQLWMSSSHS